MKQLNYIFPTAVGPIPLNLDDAEKYENAVIIQSLIGNLVTYSNQGKYEPCLATSWKQLAPHAWSFQIQTGLICENGEKITPAAFKKSIEISILHISKSSEMPIFSKLIGYANFVSEESPDISGIETSAESITFKFTEPLNSGLIEVLSWAPFGYICTENRTSNGAWIDDAKFISSGPYRITEHKPGFRHTIEQRADWPLWGDNPPQRIQFAFKKEDLETLEQPTIIDSTRPPLKTPEGFVRYELYPTFLASVLLSHESKSGFFKNVVNRDTFRKEFEKVRNNLPLKDNNFRRLTYIYDETPPKNIHRQEISEIPELPTTPLLLAGEEPAEGKRGFKVWQTLKIVLDNLGWPYQFDSAFKKMHETMDNFHFDIRIQGWAVDAAPEAWALDILFLSPKLGPVFPDPSLRVKKAIDEFNSGKISYQELSDEFNQAVFDDMAIFPLWRYGLVLFASEGINLESISPLLSVIRFNYLELPPPK